MRQLATIPTKRSRYGLGVILAIFVLLGLLYDVSVPFFEKPDELKHFAVIQYIQAQGRLPVVQAGVYKPWDQEGTQPPLYHLLAAGAVSWLDLGHFSEPPRNPHYADERSFAWRERGNNNLYLHPVGESWRMEPVFVAAHLARWLSLLAGLATVALTYRLGQLIFERGDLPLLAAALVAFVPQFLHVSAAISNDALSAALAAAGLVGLVLVLKRGSSARYAAYMGLVLGLGAITKLSLLYLGPVTGLVWLFDWRRHRSWGRLAGHAAIIGGLVGLLAGWWYWRNWQLYGDATALNAHLLYRGGALDPRPSLADLWRTELTGLELSFWAAFGAGQVLLQPWLYAVLRPVKYLVLLGMGVGFWRLLRQRPRPLFRLVALALLVGWALLIFAALLRWMQITPASWGRLLYPALPALGLLAAWGLAQLGRYRLLLPGLLAALLLGLALLGPTYYLRQAYGKPPLAASAKGVDDMERLGLVYDGALLLHGYRVGKLSVRPGEWLPVTLYWEALHPLEKNYSVFVHLLGADGAVIGQRNTYPGGGSWPTSMLEPGRVLADTYYVPVSPQAEAPAVVRLAMGIFECEEPGRPAKEAVSRATGRVVEPIVGAVPLLPHQWPGLHPARPVGANFGGQIRLVGYDLPTGATVEAGQSLPLALYWETLAAPGQDLTLFIHLVNDGEQAAGFDGPPQFPTRYWQPGYTLIDSRLLSLPADLPPGQYTLLIGWYNPDGLARLPLVDGQGDALPLLTLTVE